MVLCKEKQQRYLGGQGKGAQGGTTPREGGLAAGRPRAAGGGRQLAACRLPCADELGYLRRSWGTALSTGSGLIRDILTLFPASALCLQPRHHSDGRLCLKDPKKTTGLCRP